MSDPQALLFGQRVRRERILPFGVARFRYPMSEAAPTLFASVHEAAAAVFVPRQVAHLLAQFRESVLPAAFLSPRQ